MTLFNLLLVAAIQGLTEFLPVSSSGHLILLPRVTGQADQGLVVDVAVHVGTLGAVMLYFRRDVRCAVGGIPDLLRGRIDSPGARLALLLVVATVPVAVLGLVFHLAGIMDDMRSIALIGWMMIVFGIVLYLTDRHGRNTRTTEDWRLRDAVVLGLWQAMALVPGTSRSGACIAGARALGYARHDAARISMLMSIPTIIASGILLGGDVVLRLDTQSARDGAIAAGLAFFAALGALAFMMKLLRTVSFTPYVVYRLGLGAILLWIAYG